MAIINRKTVRQALATLLEADLVSASLAQQFYRYRAGDFKNQTPVCELVSTSISAPNMLSLSGDHETQCAFELSNFVWYADPVNNTWDEENAIDKLDDLATQTMTTLDTIAQSPPSSIDGIEFDTPSSVDIVVIGGVTYMRELFTIVCSKVS